MKKLDKYYERLEKIKTELEKIVEELNEKKEVISDRAIEHDRDMTEKEEERYDALDAKADDLLLVIDSIEDAMGNLEEYI